MATLLDPHLKLDRAKVHLDALDEQVTLFRQTKPYQVTTEEDLERGLFVVKFQFRTEVPIGVALIGGDFICCLRSCLDHLAWQLATLTTPNPDNQTQFPIHGVDSIETQTKIARGTADVPPAAVAVMKQFQPYKSGDSYKSNHLWRLNRLWSIDKHRHILLGGSITDWIIRTNTPPLTTAKHEQGGVMTFPLALKHKVEVNRECSVDVHFGSQREGLIITVKDFIEMYNFVANAVLPAFFQFFVQPQVGG